MTKKMTKTQRKAVEDLLAKIPPSYEYSNTINVMRIAEGMIHCTLKYGAVIKVVNEQCAAMIGCPLGISGYLITALSDELVADKIAELLSEYYAD